MKKITLSEYNSISEAYRGVRKRTMKYSSTATA